MCIKINTSKKYVYYQNMIGAKNMDRVNEQSFLTATEIAKALQCSLARGYKTVRELNEELEQKGYKTVKGRTNRRFFEKRFGLSQEKI